MTLREHKTNESVRDQSKVARQVAYLKWTRQTYSLEGELLVQTLPRMDAMGRKAPSRKITNALEGRREEASRFELDPHNSMSREVEEVEAGIHQFGRKRLKKKKI
ncbi:jg11149 [Pararge aegeria aegeria]|uniref:Jg11149 protein n=1 Tax=Pararge aegeria aegeria TaxID=348720 RepID=A0A8S4RIC8_9NEOP|nr:jg11149 [Pararge aegeria aegeria]